MGWIGCVRCEKFRHDFVPQTFALIAPVQLVLHRVSCSNEMIPNAPKHYEMPQNMGLGSNRVDRMRSLWKIPTWLRGTNFCINCTVVHQVLCSNEMIPNAPKHYETHQNMGLGSNGVDQMCWLRKIPTWLRGTNFCINCTSSVRFAPSFKQ